MQLNKKIFNLLLILIPYICIESCNYSNSSVALQINSINFNNLINLHEGFSNSYISLEISLQNNSDIQNSIQFQYYEELNDTTIKKSNIWIGNSINDTTFLCVNHNGIKNYILKPNENQVFEIEIVKYLQPTLSLKQIYESYYDSIIGKKLFYQISDDSKIDSLTITKSIKVNYYIDKKVVLINDSIQMNKSLYSIWLKENSK